MNDDSDPAPAPATPDVPTYDAQALFGTAKSVKIVLDAKVYTLTRTRAGKLILTK